MACGSMQQPHEIISHETTPKLPRTLAALATAIIRMHEGKQLPDSLSDARMRFGVVIFCQ